VIEFTIPLQPQPKGRPRMGRGRVHTPKKTQAAEDAWCICAAPHVPSEPISGPVRIVFVFAMPIPRSWTKKKQAAARARELKHTSKPDLDNLTKTAMDAMTRAGFWDDDSQVYHVDASKRYTLPNEETRTFVRIRPPAGEVWPT